MKPVRSFGRWCSFALAATFLAVSAAGAAEVDKKTERLWKSKCASCHGATGKGDTEKGKKQKVRDMTTADYQSKITDEDIKKSMLEGIKREKDGVKQEMDSYKDELKPDQIDALVKYVRSLGAQK